MFRRSIVCVGSCEASVVFIYCIFFELSDKALELWTGGQFC